MKQLLFLLLFLGGVALADDANSVQTHDMYKYCKIAIRMVDGETITPSEKALAGYCMGYIRGISDGIAIWFTCKGTYKINPNVSAEDLTKTFINYANAHPAEMDKTDFILMLEEAWATDSIVYSSQARQTRTRREARYSL